MNIPEAIKRSSSLREELVGTMWPTNNSGNLMIVEYYNYHKVLIEFVETKHRRFTSVNYIYAGQVFDNQRGKRAKLTKEHGYVGVGKYSKSNSTKIYDVWHNMLDRCYNESFWIKEPAYKGCSVCKEWYCYQNFAKWYEEHCLCENGQLDKDLLFKGNKIYSPQTCCILPPEINKTLVQRNSCRGDLPIGVVRARTRGELYIARCGNTYGFKRYLGCFNDPKQAFIAYKNAKENIIKFLANKFRDVIEPKAYNALINYQINITD